MYWLMFCLGLMLGATLGILLMCLFFMAKEQDLQSSRPTGALLRPCLRGRFLNRPSARLLKNSPL
jgi:hypothetical protein